MMGASMPHATAKFQFEYKVFSWATHFSTVMAGDNRCFLMALDADGAVRQLLFGENEYDYDRQTWDSLRESSPSWLFYHPFDGPVYTYMEWRNVQRETMERLIGQRFEDTDLDERAEFPASWGVMF